MYYYAQTGLSKVWHSALASSQGSTNILLATHLFQIQSLNNAIMQLESTLSKPDLPEGLRRLRAEELAVVQAKKKLILEDPNADIELTHKGTN